MEVLSNMKPLQIIPAVDTEDRCYCAIQELIWRGNLGAAIIHWYLLSVRKT
jgi:hypothetical protein